MLTVCQGCVVIMTFFVSIIIPFLCSTKIEKEITEMREDYAKKKSDMLEKTRLVRNSLHVQMHWHGYPATTIMYVNYENHSFHLSSRERWSLLQMNTKDSLGCRKDSGEVQSRIV